MEETHVLLQQMLLMMSQHVTDVAADVVVAKVTVDTTSDVSADVVDALFSSRKRFYLRMMFPLRNRFRLRNDVVVGAASEVVVDSTHFVIPTAMRFKLGVMLFMWRLLGCCSC